MADLQVAVATEQDVREMAQRRRRSPETQRLYCALAQCAPQVAIARDAGTPIGIAFAHAFEDAWQLCELFVEPSFRGQGLARELAERALEGAGDVALSAVLDPAQSDALALCMRRGGTLEEPVLQLTGSIPPPEQLAAMIAGPLRFETDSLDPARHRNAIDALDRTLLGSARPLAHRIFATTGEGFAFGRDGEFVGYLYVGRDGRIGPLAAYAASYLPALLAFGMAVLQRNGASWCSLLLPGSNLRVGRSALRAGLRIEGVCLLASDRFTGDLARYAGFSELLF